MGTGPYLLLVADAVAGKWVPDPDYGPPCRSTEELAAWLAESCAREWLG